MRLVFKARAALLGMYPSRRAASRTFSLVAWLMSLWPFSALLTVATETPQAFAMSLMDAMSTTSRSCVWFGSLCLGSASLNRFRIFTIQQVNHKIKRFLRFFVHIDTIWRFAKIRSPSFGSFVCCFREFLSKSGVILQGSAAYGFAGRVKTGVFGVSDWRCKGVMRGFCRRFMKVSGHRSPTAPIINKV